MTYDLISRQSAIEAVESLIVKGYDLRTMDRNSGICKARDELLKLPSEQPGCLDEDGTLFTVVANPYEVKKVLVLPDGFSDYLSASFYPDARTGRQMMGAEKPLVNVNKGQDAYSVIGNYILNHVTAIEDMIAVIQLNGVIIKELYMVDVDADGYFYWKSDWWEGEEDVALLDFFPVSDAERIQEGAQVVNEFPSAQPGIIRCKDCKHNPKNTWFECPMSHLTEAQRPETAWCFKGEKRSDG